MPNYEIQWNIFNSNKIICWQITDFSWHIIFLEWHIFDKEKKIAELCLLSEIDFRLLDRAIISKACQKRSNRKISKFKSSDYFKLIKDNFNYLRNMNRTNIKTNERNSLKCLNRRKHRTILHVLICMSKIKKIMIEKIHLNKQFPKTLCQQGKVNILTDDLTCDKSFSPNIYNLNWNCTSKKIKINQSIN